MKRTSQTTNTPPTKNHQPETTSQFSKKQKKQLDGAKQKEEDLKRIMDANVRNIKYLEGIRSFTSSPEWKLSLQLLDSNSKNAVGLSVGICSNIFRFFTMLCQTTIWLWIYYGPTTKS